MNMVHEANENKILKWLVRYDSNLLLMHHRFPTSTINVKRAAHPFATKQYFGQTQYILVHNGSISNADELFVDHQALGIKYHSLLQDLSFNDSEALLWDFALYMEGKQPELKAKGGIAFICLKLVKGKLEKMYFARNSNPLNMLRTKAGISLSSEGEGEAIDMDKLYTWNYQLKRLTNRVLVIPGYFKYVYTGAYTPGSYADDWNDGWNDDTKNVLARQFGDKFDMKYDAKKQLYLPIGRRAAKKKLLQRKGILPTEAQVQAEYMSYLAGVKGHFSQAYWAMEADYEWYQGLSDTVFNLRRTVLLEKVMQRLETDEEYIDEESVSSIWSKTWDNQTTF